MVDIRHETYCEAPVDVAFAYLDDYRTAPNWMFGLATFEPAGEKSQGLGSVFDASFTVKRMNLSSTVEVTEWVRDEVIGFESIKGFRNDSTWRFSADGPTRTKISIRFRYELPGGLAGRAFSKMLEPVAALSVRSSDAALRRGIEDHYAQMRGSSS